MGSAWGSRYSLATTAVTRACPIRQVAEGLGRGRRKRPWHPMCDRGAFVRAVNLPFAACMIETIARPKSDVVSALNPHDHVGRGIAGANRLGQRFGNVDPFSRGGYHCSVHSQLIDPVSRLRLFGPYIPSDGFIRLHRLHLSKPARVVGYHFAMGEHQSAVQVGTHRVSEYIWLNGQKNCHLLKRIF